MIKTTNKQQRANINNLFYIKVYYFSHTVLHRGEGQLQKLLEICLHFVFTFSWDGWVLGGCYVGDRWVLGR